MFMKSRMRLCGPDHSIDVHSYYNVFFVLGLHLVLCSVALNDAEAGKAAFHAMLDVEPPTYHQDIPIDDVSSII